MRLEVDEKEVQRLMQEMSEHLNREIAREDVPNSLSNYVTALGNFFGTLVAQAHIVAPHAAENKILRGAELTEEERKVLAGQSEGIEPYIDLVRNVYALRIADARSKS